jgi:Right handed beta helix region
MSRITNKLGWGVAGALAVALVASIAGVIYAGPLDPPAGVSTSTSTQRNLIFQPATPAGYPIIISGAQGSYLLAQDIGLTVPVPAGQDAIHITGPGITLDLDGHTVSGGGGTAASGIVVSGGGSGGAATIRNGTVTGFLADGIDASGTSYNTVEDVAVSGAPTSFSPGIVVGDYATVSDCSVVLGASGIVAVGIDATIKGSRVSANKLYGIVAQNTNDQIIGNYVADNSGSGGAAEIAVNGTNDVVEDNRAYNNAPGKDVFRISGTGDVVLHNVARSGGGLGTDYVIGAGNDVGPITTAAAGGAPDGNVAE